MEPLPTALTTRTAGGSWRAAAASALLALALCARARPARAQIAGGSASAEVSPAGGSARRRPARRPVPDYDGRGRPPPSAAEVAAWVPRVVLFPLVLTLEVVRRPLGAVLSPPAVERAFEGVAGVTTDLSSHGTPAARGVSISLAPTVRLETDRRPEVGVLFAADRLGSHRNRLYLSGAFGGERDYVGEAWDRLYFAQGDVGLRGAYVERPDNPFYGRLGPDSAQGDLSRYWERRAGGYLTGSLRLARVAGLFVQTGVRYTDVQLPVPVADATSQGRDRYAAFVTDAEVWVDSRGAGLPAVSGARAVVRIHHGADLARVAERRWLVAEAMAGGYLEVLRPGRVLGAEVYAALSAPLGGDPVPFTELPALGGVEPLGGFLAGRFRGPSALAASVLYRWPVWVWLEAEMRVGVGNAFGQDFSGFSPGATFASWDVVLRSTAGGLARVELLVGAGSSRLDAPRFEIASARMLFAVTRSF